MVLFRDFPIKPNNYGIISYMSLLKLLLLIIAISFGVFLFFYGGYDDSPGAQGLGLLIVITSIFGIVRNHKNKIS